VLPIWSPDGSRVVFSSNRNGVHDLYVKFVSGSRDEELLLSTPLPKQANDWSADGRVLLFSSHDPKGSFDLMALSMDGNHEISPVAQTPFDEQYAQFSPDGRWVAYQSNETGRNEIYVQPFPGPGGRLPVSTSGGSQVRWARNGEELFYVAADAKLMSVPIRLGSGAPEIGSPIALFAPPIGNTAQQNDFRHQYMVAADGRSFLIATVKDASPPPITLIFNWKPRR
jgi:hypothetical protein